MYRETKLDLGKLGPGPYHIRVSVRVVKVFRFPKSEAIAGVRLVDKSFSGRENFRMEVWLKLEKDENEEAREIRNFIDEKYN